MLVAAPLLIAVLVTAPSARAPLTDLEQLQRQIVYLQDQLNRILTAAEACQVEFAPYRRQRDDQIVRQAKATLKATIEAAHPCCTFNPETGVLEPKPEPSVAPKP